MSFLDFYKEADPESWQGRVDSEDVWDLMRWHQAVRLVNLKTEKIPALKPGQKGTAIIGYRCEEGVRRNKGRLGTKRGPFVLRKAVSNFPVHFDKSSAIVDLGNICCKERKLEETQQALGELCAKALKKGYALLVFGGGHDVAFGHFSGVRKAFAEANIGVINFDAHFDLRKPDAETGVSSGTPFWQIAREETARGKDFNYLCLAVQKNSNTKCLFDTAESLGAEYIYGDSFHAGNRAMIERKVQAFIDRMDCVYLTICLDAFAAAHAPGVSAPAYSGLIPDPFFRSIFKMILASGKVVSMDIAELNPDYDVDRRTAKLAGSLAFEYVAEKL